jgi:signal transduction histidine kinase
MFGLRFVRIDNLGVDACIDAFTLTALLFPVLYFGVFKAITARNVALTTSERNLLVAVAQLHKEALERKQAEEALLQAQKMEAIGQLTGGIAHDFNNMLQSIAGSMELMERRIAQGRAEEVGRYIGLARDGVDRAASLTHRLLAFARRQALQPKPVELDKLIDGMAELIRSAVGPQVEVELHMGDGIWAVLCDPNQLENVLLNLAINARDAMPDGGRLTISMADVELAAAFLVGQEGAEPGEYVEIAVADTGTGMTADVLARAFEPFFTTKPSGQGTGMGLSQLYGFVRQSDGVVKLESVPGQGTTVRIYLPRHLGAAGQQTSGAEVARTVAEAISGTVLVVEDEVSLRAISFLPVCIRR